MIEKALMKAGGVRYLEEQAKANPGAFLTLVGKLVPRDLNLTSAERGGISLHIDLSAARQSDQGSLPAVPAALPDAGETVNQD